MDSDIPSLNPLIRTSMIGSSLSVCTIVVQLGGCVVEMLLESGLGIRIVGISVVVAPRLILLVRECEIPMRCGALRP